jgi:hypothetical protein
MIGGRGGSMDIASFMGIQTASWDKVDDHARWFPPYG